MIKKNKLGGVVASINGYRIRTVTPTTNEKGGYGVYAGKKLLKRTFGTKEIAKEYILNELSSKS